MKKFLLSLLIATLFLPELVLASHYMGGEITWECMTGANYTTAQQGRYRFHLKLYRECGGITFGSTETLMTTVPGLPSITMTLKTGWPKDISPKCYTDSLSLSCAGATSSNTGAMQEYYYTSNSSYPNGVQLNGVPPSTGWMFYNESCCRNPCTNITNATSYGWRLRAIMYPYNNQNVYPCFDNSPTFSESPKPVMCSDYPIYYNHNATDKDYDSLFFEWGEPLDQGGTSINSYLAGYSYLNPLPGILHNPNNIPASINPKTGEISLVSFTKGAFVTVTKVSAFRNGQKISEIWRDVQLVISICDLSSPPSIVFLNNNSNSITKNVTALDTVSVVLFSKDTQSINIKFSAFGSEFGNFIPASSGNYPRFDTNGCQYYPCATLSNAGTSIVPLIGNGIVSTFFWVVDYNHIKPGKTNEEYEFTFYAQGDRCAVPKVSTAKLNVNIHIPFHPTQQPSIISTELLNSYGDVKIKFNPPLDSDTSFQQYEFFTSPTKSGTYTFAGLLNTYNSTYFIHRNPLTTNSSVYYYMRVRDFKNGITQFSINSDTVNTKFVDLSVDSIQYFHSNTGTIDMRMNISNKGNISVSNFSLRFDIVGSSSFNQLYTGMLLPGQSILYSFPPVNSTDSGNITVCGNIMQYKDFNASNNMVCTQAFTSIESIFEKGFKLAQSSPNPTKGKTKINFTIPISGKVDADLKNILGQIIWKQSNEFPIGENTIEIDLSSLQGGIYFYNITLNGISRTQKLTLIK